jgi:beta-N-acetylhexosaminidase
MISRSRASNLRTAALALLALSLIFLNIESTAVADSTDNVLFDRENSTLNISSLTTRQKIAQMIVTYGKEENTEALQRMFIGGIYLVAKPTQEDFIGAIEKFQESSAVPMFVTADLEGCDNPFESFRLFTAASEIKTAEDAYHAGYEEGRMLKALGFNMNFAPVADLEDVIWNCRNFLGTPDEVADKASSYIAGLHKSGIISTTKHYPGRTLSYRDPHKYIVYAQIGRNDTLPFEMLMNSTDAIMVSHLIVNGSVDSEGKPSDVSEKLLGGLKNSFGGLLVTDEIRMLSLRSYYSNIDRMYVDLFNSGNDLILNFDTNVQNLRHMISVVEVAVKSGEIDERKIDDSVTRILATKGINVVS